MSPRGIRIWPRSALAVVLVGIVACGGQLGGPAPPVDTCGAPGKGLCPQGVFCFTADAGRPCQCAPDGSWVCGEGRDGGPRSFDCTTSPSNGDVCTVPGKKCQGAIMSECGLDLCTCSGNAWQCERAQCLCPDPSQVMTGVACPELMMTCTGIDDCALATSCVCAAADAGPRQWVCRSPSCAMDAGGD